MGVGVAVGAPCGVLGGKARDPDCMPGGLWIPLTTGSWGVCVLLLLMMSAGRQPCR